jgi:hypothetical protein
MQQQRDFTQYAVILNERDNVATALADMPPGAYALPSVGAGEVIALPEEVKAGFKVALRAIGKGRKVYKYGYAIGLAERDIGPGECVHIHNIASAVGRSEGADGHGPGHD